jgi:hypothetical protein
LTTVSCQGAVSERFKTSENPPPDVITPPKIPVQTIRKKERKREKKANEKGSCRRQREKKQYLFHQFQNIEHQAEMIVEGFVKSFLHYCIVVRR